MKACGNLSLVGYTGREAGVYPLRCKSWSCARCGPRKAKATIARVRGGMKLGPCRFFTITSPGGEGAEESYAQFQVRWRRLHEHIRRRFGSIEYVAVVERQKRGNAHIHVVYRGAWIPQRWLSKAAEEAGFGAIADIRRAPSTIARYLAKYLTKELSDPSAAPPRYFRRVRWSHHWFEWGRTKPTHAWTEWRLVDAVPDHAARSAQQRGYLVVEVVSDDREEPCPSSRVPRWLRLEELHEPRAFRPDFQLGWLGPVRA